MTKSINYTIYNNSSPCIMAVVDTNAECLDYATYGHCLIVNAIMSDKSEIQFADPLAGKKWGSYTIPAFYMKKSSSVSKICIGLIH